MIYLEYTVLEWLKKVPALKADYGDDRESFMCSCGEEHWRPFIAKRGLMKGFECEVCRTGTWVNEDPDFVQTILELSEKL